MTAPTSEIHTVRVREIRPDARLDLQGTDTRAQLDLRVLQAPPGSVVGLDLRGLEYLGYGHAKGSIREMLIDRAAGMYGERRFVVLADQGPAFLDGLVDALQQIGAFVLVLRSPDTLDEAQLVGEVSKNLAEVFEELRVNGPLPVEEIARRVEQSTDGAELRLDMLLEAGIATRARREAPDAEEWWYRIL